MAAHQKDSPIWPLIHALVGRIYSDSLNKNHIITASVNCVHMTSFWWAFTSVIIATGLLRLPYWFLYVSYHKSMDLTNPQQKLFIFTAWVARAEKSPFFLQISALKAPNLSELAFFGYSSLTFSVFRSIFVQICVFKGPNLSEFAFFFGYSSLTFSVFWYKFVQICVFGYSSKTFSVFRLKNCQHFGF